VYLDDVQFQRGGFQNRTKIRHNGSESYLTVPVVKGPLETEIRHMEISYASPWQHRHASTLRAMLGDMWAGHEAMMEELLSSITAGPVLLSELSMATTEWMLRAVGATCRTVRSSDLGVTGGRVSRVVRICRALGATEYLSGGGASIYQTSEDFSVEGIELKYLLAGAKNSDISTTLLSPYSSVTNVLRFGKNLPELLERQYVVGDTHP
jgi:hypothetical protein